MLRLPRAPAGFVYLLLVSVGPFAFSLITTVNMVYQATTAALNPLQLVLIGTTLEIAVLLFETPTGAIADTISRRLSIVIGVAVMGAGFILEGTIPTFAAIAIAQLVWGLGYTFTSGATDAWLVDEIGPADAGKLILRGSQAGQIAALLAIPVAVSLGNLAINLPIIAGGGLYVGLAVCLAIIMPEEGFTPSAALTPEKTVAGSHPPSLADRIRTTIMAAVALARTRPLLIMIILISGCYGLFGEGYDRLWTPHLIENFRFPALAGTESLVIWFGMIRGISMALSITLAEVAIRLIDTSRPERIASALLWISIGIGAGILVLALSTSLWLALAGFWLAWALRETSEPLFAAWINHHVDSKVRATVLSIYSQANAAGQFVGGPSVGLVGTHISLRAALAISAGLLLSALPLFQRTIALERRPPE